MESQTEVSFEKASSGRTRRPYKKSSFMVKENCLGQWLNGISIQSKDSLIDVEEYDSESPDYPN